MAGLTFPEAPTWHDGAVWCSDVAAGGVHRVDPTGNLETWLAGRRGIGGLLSTSSGALLASGRDLVDVMTGSVVRERPPGSTGINDLGTDERGTAFAGVLTFRPTQGESPTPGAVARLAPDGEDWAWWSGPAWPNGIGALPGGGLVIADFADGTLWRFADTRSAAHAERIGRSPTGHLDGIAIDGKGLIWAATGPGHSIECWSPDGELLATHSVEAAFVSSLAFGGPDLATLFVTAVGYRDRGGVLLRAAAAAPGSPVAPAVI